MDLWEINSKKGYGYLQTPCPPMETEEKTMQVNIHIKSINFTL